MSSDNIKRTPPIRHPRCYGSENLTFEVDGYLFQLPVRRLNESKYFQDMLGAEHLGGSVEGKSDDHPIALGGITEFEMESFVHILDARVFDKEVQREWKQLAAALHLATMWEFEDVRARLIKDMSHIINQGGIEPLDRIEVSIQCRVSDWLHPAYEELCDREEGVTNDEAKRLGLDRLAAIYRVRDRRHANTAAHNAHTAVQNAYTAAQSAQPAAQVVNIGGFGGFRNASSCGYCGRSNNTPYDPIPAVLQALAVTKTPTLNLVMGEDILSSRYNIIPTPREKVHSVLIQRPRLGTEDQRRIGSEVCPSQLRVALNDMLRPGHYDQDPRTVED
ncbi:hypothetical protein FRC01_004811 [Tulasnella sp. 417]|nr:hypothetical protein FRC01_004811 [Tulasnella sp. 417]